MADWQQFLQSIIFAVIFSFLLAKLFSIIFAFREENLRITRSHSPQPESETGTETTSVPLDSLSSFSKENEPWIGQGDERLGNDRIVRGDYGEIDESDDDWEGVESTELDETFSAATAFVAATAADRNALKVPNEVQLQLYGLYKIAIEGPCTAPQPSALKMTSRAKWQAWQKLGTMPPEEAMEKYIDIVTELYPTWVAGSMTLKRKDETSMGASTSGFSGPMGPVFSTFIYEEEPGSELKLDAIHASAREGDEDKVLKCLEGGVSINVKDSEGRTPLHWAVDRGHLNISALLLNRNADVNAKDNEGQTALHYAAVCERTEISELLVKHGADIEITDNEGHTAMNLGESSWPGLAFLAKKAE